MDVLILDDHRDSAAALARLLVLKNPGWAVQVAHDGASGLAFALAGQTDVVIIDLNLPDMTGEEVAVEIRRRSAAAPPILIALSGNVGEIMRHQASGVFEHALTKPVKVDRLMDILRT
jgi:CheY-like chemotaxis protein